MRRVIQKTITTTKIISLTITHSEEEVEYALTTGVDQLNESEASLPAEAAAVIALEPECEAVDDESPDATIDTSAVDKVAGQ
jgi:hypothetical protein